MSIYVNQSNFTSFVSTVGYDIFGFESFPGFGIDPLTFVLEVFFLRSASSGSVKHNMNLHEIKNDGQNWYFAPSDIKAMKILRHETDYWVFKHDLHCFYMREKCLPLGNGFISTAGALSLRWWSVLLKPWKVNKQSTKIQKKSKKNQFNGEVT